MGKNNKKRKRSNANALFHAAKARMNGEEPSPKAIVVAPIAAAAAVDTTTISDAALTTTIQTLATLVSDPTLFHTKRFKDLRRTLHPLVLEQMQSYDKGIDYRHKATHALQCHHWSDALAALGACLDFSQFPKQGTVQRWVRDCTAAQSDGCQMKLLQAILRLSSSSTGGGGDGNKHDPGQALADHMAKDPDARDELVIMEGWKWWDADDDNDSDAAAKKDEEKKQAANGDETIDTSKMAIQSRVVYRESAAERTPPNHYDLLLHALETTDDTSSIIQWSTSSTETPPPLPTAHHAIPFLPQPARVLSNVLTPQECQQLRHVMTTLGYRPDHPVAHAHPTGIDSCEWMVSSQITATIMDRVKEHLPATLNVGKKKVQLYGLNPRWRCFRYGQDCVYRPHLDGSWPLCFMDEDGNYKCFKQQQQQQQHPGGGQDQIKSYLTFLMYLNDDFEGGETRFYLPQGVARGVVPKTGSVCVFPQGNTASLIHEGSQVTQGTKYVVRTDVLYRPLLNDDDDDDDDDDNENGNETVEMEAGEDEEPES